MLRVVWDVLFQIIFIYILLAIITGELSHACMRPCMYNYYEDRALSHRMKCVCLAIILLLTTTTQPAYIPNAVLI